MGPLEDPVGYLPYAGVVQGIIPGEGPEDGLEVPGVFDRKPCRSSVRPVYRKELGYPRAASPGWFLPYISALCRLMSTIPGGEKYHRYISAPHNVTSGGLRLLRKRPPSRRGSKAPR